MSNSVRARVEELVQELDMLVYTLERAPPEERERLNTERRNLRRELERVRDLLEDLSRSL